MKKKISNAMRIASVAVCGLLFPPILLSQSDTVAIRGARLVTVTQGVIENGTLLIHEGIIAAVGAEVPIPSEATVIPCEGKTVMPGLIDGFTNLGTADLPSFGTDDDEATQPLTPHVRVIDGFNPDNRFIPLARKTGVTTALSAPGEGNVLSGQSALIRLSGDSVDDMVVRFPVGVHAVLGETPKLRYGKKATAPMTRMGAAAMLRQKLVDAKDYVSKLERPGNDRPESNLELEALIPIVKAE